jgi:lipoprotein-releasing system permease protein
MNEMRLSASIALRFLKSNKTQTVVIILGIGVGVAVQIFIGSLILGLQTSLIDKTIGNSAQITVTATKDNVLMQNDTTLIQKIQGSDNRIQAASPVLDQPAFLGTTNSQSVLVRGFNMARADGIYQFSNYLTEGSLPKVKGDFLVGSVLKQKNNLAIGDAITLVTPDKRTVTGTIVGFFDLKVAQINGSWCVTTLETAQTLFRTGNKISSIEMQVNRADVFKADVIAAAITKKLNDVNLTVLNWKSQNQQLLSGLQGQSISSIMIQVFVMLSVLLGIASVLAITVMQKSRQIGILKAMGIKNRTASLIFLTEGFILGIFGAIAGVAFGVGLSVAFTKFALNTDGTPVVPLSFNPAFIALSACVAVLACLLASLIPARKSSKLDPIDIIRNN